MESFEETPTAKVDTNASRHAEWTADKVIMMGVNDFAIAYNIADAHNASLNKERGRCERGLCKGAALFAGKEAETIQQLRTQLAKLDKAHKEACEICREAIIKRDKYQRQLAAAQAAITVFRKNWPKTHKAIRSDIMLAEAVEEIHALAELYKQKSDTSALDAAIEKAVKESREEFDISEWHKGFNAAVEAGEENKLRLIAETTAEAQKPLVATLEKVRSWLKTPADIGAMILAAKDIDAALAKIGGKP